MPLADFMKALRDDQEVLEDALDDESESLAAARSASHYIDLAAMTAGSALIELIHTFEGTETTQALIVGRDITGVGAFAH